jgi:hypothetical protein
MFVAPAACRLKTGASIRKAERTPRFLARSGLPNFGD